MSLQSHIVKWSGEALRHIPSNSGFDVLDFRFAGRSAGNRWNLQGQPTLYLAGDEGVLIAEWGRHFEVDRTPALQTKTVARDVFSLDVTIEHILDLRSPEVWEALSLEGAPHCFLDVTIARAAANYVRAATEAQGILVPSAGFLDRLDRWCLVVFLEKFTSPMEFVKSVSPRGQLSRS